MRIEKYEYLDHGIDMLRIRLTINQYAAERDIRLDGVSEEGKQHAVLRAVIEMCRDIVLRHLKEEACA